MVYFYFLYTLELPYQNLIYQESMVEREKEDVSSMIEIYCRGKHGAEKYEICENCAKLQDYALERLDKCKFGEMKPNCQDCTVHCYKSSMRIKIKEVMKYAGPRMIIYNPGGAWRHVVGRFKKKMLPQKRSNL